VLFIWPATVIVFTITSATTIKVYPVLINAHSSSDGSYHANQPQLWVCPHHPSPFIIIYYRYYVFITQQNFVTIHTVVHSVLRLPSVLWHCWLGIRKSIRSVKKLSDEVLAWLSVWSKMPMIFIWFSWCHGHPIISCFIKIQTGLTFLVPAYPSCPGKDAAKQVPVYLSTRIPSVVHWPLTSISCRMTMLSPLTRKDTTNWTTDDFTFSGSCNKVCLTRHSSRDMWSYPHIGHSLCSLLCTASAIADWQASWKHHHPLAQWFSTFFAPCTLFIICLHVVPQSKTIWVTKKMHSKWYWTWYDTMHYIYVRPKADK